MKKITFIILAVLMISGCTEKIDFKWKEYPIKPHRIAQASFSQGREVNVYPGDADRNIILLASSGGLRLHYGSLYDLSSAITTQLKTEIRKRGVKLVDGASSTIEITVNNISHSTGVIRFGVTLDFDVKLGNGVTIPLQVTNESPTVFEYVMNGAVAWAVIKTLNNEQVKSYLNE